MLLDLMREINRRLRGWSKRDKSEPEQTGLPEEETLPVSARRNLHYSSLDELIISGNSMRAIIDPRALQTLDKQSDRCSMFSTISRQNN